MCGVSVVTRKLTKQKTNIESMAGIVWHEMVDVADGEGMWIHKGCSAEWRLLRLVRLIHVSCTRNITIHIDYVMRLFFAESIASYDKRLGDILLYYVNESKSN